MDRETAVDLAKQYASEGFLCSEAVLMATSRYLGIEDHLIPRIATGFGAGVGACGSVCGALSGGVMALGIKFGRDSPIRKEGKRPYDFASELLDKFETKYGCISCRELTRCDLRSESGRRKYNDERIWVTRCRDYIGAVTQMVLEQMCENQSPSV